MLGRKLLLKKYIFFSIFAIVTCMSNYSQAGLFIARNFDRFTTGTAQAVEAVWDKAKNRVVYVTGLGPVMDRLDTISDRLTDRANTIGDQLVDQLHQAGTNLVENFDARFDATAQRLTGRVETMSNNLIDNVNQRLDATTQQLTDRIETISNNLVQDVNQRLDATAQNVINNVDVRAQRLLNDVDVRLDRALKKGMVMAGGVALTSIASWYGTKFLYNVLDRRYRKPKLFQETSRKTWLQKLKELVYKTQSEPQVLIFDSKKEAELANLTQSVKNTNAKLMAGDPTVRHRSVLFWGPPGTGKTAFASKLARESGMDFEVMSGADISKLNTQDALVALDEVFDYAQKSKNGLILMVDEAESLFAKREGAKPDSESYLVLSKFLSLTSERVKKLMLVITTNHKEILDEALVSRLDRSVDIQLPDYSERLKILNLYKDKYLTDGRYNSAEFISSVTEHLNDYKMDQLANQLTGFSGRDLESVMHNIKSESGNTLTAEAVNKVVQDALNKFIQFHPQASSTF